MSMYHLSVKYVSRGQGRSAVGAAAYRSGEKLYNDYDGLTHDFTKKKGILHSEILLPDNAPNEYYDRETFWNAVEKSEKRMDARTAREIEIALPIELDRKQQLDLVRDYIRTNFINLGMGADFSLHDGKHTHDKDAQHEEAESDRVITPDNPHAHILLTTRPIGQKGLSAKKNRDWDKRQNVVKWREQWALFQNKEFERLGFDSRVDHRSNKDRGLIQEPTVHEGPTVRELEKRGINTDVGEINRQIKKRNQELKKIERELQNEQRKSQGLLEAEKRFIEQKQEIQGEQESATLELEAIKKQEPTKLQQEKDTNKPAPNQQPQQKEPMRAEAETPRQTQSKLRILYEATPIPNEKAENLPQPSPDIQAFEDIASNDMAMEFADPAISSGKKIITGAGKIAEFFGKHGGELSEALFSHALGGGASNTPRPELSPETERHIRLLMGQCEDLEERGENIDGFISRIESLKQEKNTLNPFDLKKRNWLDDQISQIELSKKQAEQTLERDFRIKRQEIRQQIKYMQDELEKLRSQPMQKDKAAEDRNEYSDRIKISHERDGEKPKYRGR